MLISLFVEGDSGGPTVALGHTFDDRLKAKAVLFSTASKGGGPCINSKQTFADVLFFVRHVSSSS